MKNAYTEFAERLNETPQTERADQRQVPNNAGGYAFVTSDLGRLKRFLVLGSDGGSFYQSAQALTAENAKFLIESFEKGTDEQRFRMIDAIEDVSKRGLAPRQSPTLFAYAIACSIGSPESKAYALSLFNELIRTGTQLFEFRGYVEQFRRWGRGLRSAVARWYTDKPVDQVAYQVTKYRQRNGMDHLRMLRMAHPKTVETGRKNLFDWIAGREVKKSDLPKVVSLYLKAQKPDADIPKLIAKGNGAVSWEMLPDEALGKPETWDALVDAGLPLGALIRQLPRLTRIGYITPWNQVKQQVAEILVDPVRLQKARIHPIKLLIAMKTYASGQGKGSSWEPVQEIVDALNDAFYASFAYVEPTNKRTMVALDVSASMTWPASMAEGLTAAEIGAAFSLVLKSTEPDAAIFAFSTQFQQLPISPRQRLNDALATTMRLSHGGTDCSLPMVIAREKGLPVDTFVIITDNETRAGRVHPHQALRAYQKESGIPAKLVVLATQPTPFTIADPADPGMLDIHGFTADVPQLVADFSRGF